MSSHTPYRLFPSHAAVPLQSSASLSQKSQMEDFNGLAFHVTASPTPVVPSNPIQHNLFCDPFAHPPLRNKFHNGRRLSTCSSRYSQATAVSPQMKDQLAPLPVNTQFTSNPTRQERNPFRRNNAPTTIQAPAQEDVPIIDHDQLSPLPPRTQFNHSTSAAEYPAPLRCRSASPHLTRSNTSGSRQTTDSRNEGPAMRSMFPQYDSSKPIDAQQYYPTARSPEPVITSPVEKYSTQRNDSAVALVDGYEHIPVAGAIDLGVIWKASTDGLRKGTRKVQLGIYQPFDKGTSITIGCSPQQILYSMMTKSNPNGESKSLVIEKHSTQEATPTQVAQIPMPAAENPDQTTIFPQMAAIAAIEAVSSSPLSTTTSSLDPRGGSHAAIRLAQDALGRAHRKHECLLQRATRQRDLMGGVTATYTLSHSEQGNFAVTVSRSHVGKSGATRAKISLHHPTATPAAIAAENLVLAFLDFGRDACVLDIPGLLAFESKYIIDVAVCALLSVAAIESEAMKKDVVSFPAPPKTPMSRSKSKRGATTAAHDKKSMNKSKKKGTTSSDFKAGEEVEVPGAVALVGMTFKAGFWVVKISLKATKKGLVGAHRLAKKL